MGNNASVSIAVLFVGLLVALGVQLSALMTLNTRTTRLTRSARSNLLFVTARWLVQSVQGWWQAWPTDRTGSSWFAKRRSWA